MYCTLRPVNALSYQGVSPTVNTLTWQWTDVGTEEGYEVRIYGTETMVEETEAGVITVVEDTLSENTLYNRYCVAYNLIPDAASEALDQSQTNASSTDLNTYGSYMRGQTFTPGKDGWLSKVEPYCRKYNTASYDLRVSVYPVDGSNEPDVHAEPEDAATPSLLSSIKMASPSMYSNATFKVLGKRLA